MGAAVARASVLILEDDKNLNKLLCLALSQKYKVASASKVSQAKFMLQNQTFDCIVSDLKIGNLHASDMIHNLKTRNDAINKYTPLVVISGQLTPNDLSQLKAHTSKILLKPFRPSELTGVVDKLISK